MRASLNQGPEKGAAFVATKDYINGWIIDFMEHAVQKFGKGKGDVEAIGKGRNPSRGLQKGL